MGGDGAGRCQRILGFGIHMLCIHGTRRAWLHSDRAVPMHPTHSPSVRVYTRGITENERAQVADLNKL